MNPIAGRMVVQQTNSIYRIDRCGFLMPLAKRGIGDWGL
jgi:hypothetical protein